jgi:hypothetical protein
VETKKWAGAVAAVLWEQIVVGSQSGMVLDDGTLYCTQPPHAEVTKQLRPHQEGSGSRGGA